MLKIIEDEYGGGYDIKEDLPEGWQTLIDAMEKELEGYEIEIWSVKEKYGYMSLNAVCDQEAWDIVRKYEHRSGSICMHCGKPKKEGNLWCDECTKKFKKEW